MAAMANAANAATATHDGPSTSDANGRHLLDLPQETVNLIFDQFEDHEMPALMGVSHAFQDLAAARLYRSINYSLSDDGNGLQVDPLVDILETLATSEYNYAAFIKEIHVTSTAFSDRTERACRDRLFTSSCGKLLNLTLHMVLKRAASLETFDWDVRVELSPSVLTKLSSIASLQHLNIRLQPGPSLYSRSGASYGASSAPLSTPLVASSENNTPSDNFKSVPRPRPERQSKAIGSFAQFKNISSFGALEIDTLEYVPELARCITASSKSLKHLALSFSENMTRKAKEAQAETSDTELTLSDGELSENGAPPTHHSGHEHTAESWQMARDAQEAALARILGLHSFPESSPQSVAIDKLVSQADKEVLDRIKSSHRKEKDKDFLNSIREILKRTPDLSERKDAKFQRFIDRLEHAASKYLERSDFSSKELKKRKDATGDQIPPKKLTAKSSKAYQYPGYTSVPQANLSSGAYIPTSQPSDEMWITSNGNVFLPTMGPSHSPHYSVPGPSSNFSSKYYGGPSSIWVPPNHKHALYGPGFHAVPETAQTVGGPKANTKKSLASKSSSSSLFSQVKSGGGSTDQKSNNEDVSNPSQPRHENDQNSKRYDDDIDIDHPDDIDEDIDDQVFVENGNVQDTICQDSELGVAPPLDEHRSKEHTLQKDPSNLSIRQRKGKEVVRDTDSLGETLGKTTLLEHSSKASASMAEYLRLSHGLALESIALHRIPVKPSVLFRAIDVSRLKHLTLLDVGPQRAAWAMLSKINKNTPLQLEIIHTNNVTQSLLVFLNGLEPGTLEELYLFEPSNRHRSANTQKTSVSISEIRKQALKKHIGALRILTIRNDGDTSWSLDRETTRLLSHAGKLRELLVAMNSEAFHLFLRHFPRLAQLHALHIIYQPKSSHILSSTQATHDPPNPVNMVVNQPPPIAMPHPPHPPSQYTASTRMTSQAKEALLLELRAAVVDAVALCQQTELEWLGLSYGSAETRGEVRLARLFNWRGEKRSDTGSEHEELDTASSSSDSDEDGYMDDVIGLEDWIPMAEAEAQIWERSVWIGKL